ncbi:MAG: hypothetical protein Ct9H300mP16_12750 [Pseudomonadota bacterium]|nr:MAG: hypothetical protein Ct9H300mP16_12750 [Pseudomonadota bacterium]
MTITVGGGLESISLVQNDNMNRHRARDDWIKTNQPALYMSMLETAEIVSARYNISRHTQDEYAVQSQDRTHQAQTEGRFDNEIVPLTSIMKSVDREKPVQVTDVEVTLEKDEGNRPGNDARDPLYVEAGVCRWNESRRGSLYYRGQCVSAFGRCLGSGADGCQAS